LPLALLCFAFVWVGFACPGTLRSRQYRAGVPHEDAAADAMRASKRKKTKGTAVVGFG